VRAVQMQPLTMAALAGLTPDGVTVVSTTIASRMCLDFGHKPCRHFGANFHRETAYEIAAEFRRRNVPVVLGGFHATAVPEEGGTARGCGCDRRG